MKLFIFLVVRTNNKRIGGAAREEMFSQRSHKTKVTKEP